jgi:hypothetical protein
MLHYVAIDADGKVLGLERTADQAVDAALEDAPEATVQVQEVDESRLNPAPTCGSTAARKSVKLSSLGRIPERAARMSIKEAHARLKPLFAGLSAKEGTVVKAYDTPYGMTRSWIGQNYKTSKKHPEEKAKVMGLTLTPYDMVYSRIAVRPKTYTRKFTDRLKRELPPKPPGFNLCSHSSPLCRDSCLVYAGQNAAAVYNTHRKAMQTVALLREPEAFMRVLVAAIEKHRDASPKQGYQPYMRLNVLSDIPWECIAPWIFDYFSDMQFYDYTKIPGRKPPSNYDITFSFSGTDANIEASKSELRKGHKVAVVFLAQKQKKGEWVSWKKGKIPLPDEFWGYPVVDGDISDVRPVDPSPSIVGLRWKSPSGKKAGKKVDPLGEEFVFVQPTFVVDGEARLGRPNPWSRPNPNREQWLVTAVTPRHENITHDVAQAM